MLFTRRCWGAGTALDDLEVWRSGSGAVWVSELKIGVGSLDVPFLALTGACGSGVKARKRKRRWDFIGRLTSRLLHLCRSACCLSTTLCFVPQLFARPGLRKPKECIHTIADNGISRMSLRRVKKFGWGLRRDEKGPSSVGLSTNRPLPPPTAPSSQHVHLVAGLRQYRRPRS